MMLTIRYTEVPSTKNGVSTLVMTAKGKIQYAMMCPSIVKRDTSHIPPGQKRRHLIDKQANENNTEIQQHVLQPKHGDIRQIGKCLKQYFVAVYHGKALRSGYNRFQNKAC